MRAADFGQSFMQRRQKQQWEAEDRDVAARQRELAAPVVQSKLLADQASALSSLETFKQQNRLKTRFASEAPTANEEYQAALALPTFAAQERALAVLQPKYSWMGMIDEGKGFVSALNNSRAQAFQYALADHKIDNDMKAIDARNRGVVEAIGARGVETRKTNAEIGRGLTTDQKLRNSLQAAIDDGDEEGAAFYQARINRLSRPTSGFTTGERIEDLNQRALAAEKAGDAALAKQLRDRANYEANPNATDMSALERTLGIKIDTAPVTPPAGTSVNPASVPVNPAGTTPSPATANTRDVINSIKF